MRPMLDYSETLERRHILADGRSVVIRSMRPEDEAAARLFFRRVYPQSFRTRFLTLLRAFAPVDSTVLVCEARVDGEPRLVGEARYSPIPGSPSCSFGIVVTDAWHRTGAATLLMLALLAHARARGCEAMEGIVLRENRGMLPFLRALGFAVQLRPDDATLLRVVKRLDHYDLPSPPG